MSKLAGLDSNQFKDKYINAALENSENQLTSSFSAKRRISSKKTFKAQKKKPLKESNPVLYDKLFPEERRSRYTFLSEGGKYIYHVSIIDYLCFYNWQKVGETLWK